MVHRYSLWILSRPGRQPHLKSSPGQARVKRGLSLASQCSKGAQARSLGAGWGGRISAGEFESQPGDGREESEPGRGPINIEKLKESGSFVGPYPTLVGDGRNSITFAQEGCSTHGHSNL